MGCVSRTSRIYIPRTPVNKGKRRKGRESSFDPGPSQGGRYVLLLSPHLLTLKVQVLGALSALPAVSVTPLVSVAR